MYKAGDFTNGKMNEMFSLSYSDGSIDVKHKQFGAFSLVNKEHDLRYLLTSLEISYGVYPVDVEDGIELRSVLCGGAEHISHTGDYLSTDNYTPTELLNGLFFLSDVCSEYRVGNDCYASRMLMRLVCAKENTMSVDSILNADKESIKETITKRNNSLSKDVISDFLDDPSHHKVVLFRAVCDVVYELALSSIEESTTDWNVFEIGSVFAAIAKEYNQKVRQELLEVCVEHLLNQKIINLYSPDEYTINIKTILLKGAT